MLRRFCLLAFSTIGAAALLHGGPARAQMDAGQLCVNQCLFHHGPASSPAYHACVAEICEGKGQVSGGQAAPSRQRPAGPAWVSGVAGGGQGRYAGIESGRHSLSYMCKRGESGILAVEGMAGSGRSLAIRVDGTSFRPQFISRGGMRYTSAARDSALLRALLSGNAVEISDDRGRVRFSLSGSGAAIRAAMAGCGL
ncbi:MAG: hypothetical protein D1H97_14675 [Paracoccus sp. BP8]|nr:MAG: hypothetical protein D1H97_14675 [Paracoccus sp. BP8]